MTGNLLVDAIISLSAIALMVLVAKLAFKNSDARLSLDAARERLVFDEPDFAPTAWFLDERGRAALAENENGEFAVVILVGIDSVTRRFAASAANFTYNADEISLELGDVSIGAISLCGGDAAQWARKLADS